jgi:hypothetical protein
MGTPPEQRVKLHAESLKRIAQSSDNDLRRFLLTECLEAYVKLNEAQRQELKTLLETESYREAKPLMTTTFELGVQQGMQMGLQQGKIEASRENLLMLLRERFGPLQQSVEKRISELTLEQLQRLMVDQMKAKSLEELKLLD